MNENCECVCYISKVERSVLGFRCVRDDLNCASSRLYITRAVGFRVMK